MIGVPALPHARAGDLGAIRGAHGVWPYEIQAWYGPGDWVVHVYQPGSNRIARVRALQEIPPPANPRIEISGWETHLCRGGCRQEAPIPLEITTTGRTFRPCRVGAPLVSTFGTRAIEQAGGFNQFLDWILTERIEGGYWQQALCGDCVSHGPHRRPLAGTRHADQVPAYPQIADTGHGT